MDVWTRSASTSSMAAWRSMEVIDLTGDDSSSSISSGNPLPRVTPVPLPNNVPRRTPIPLPDNVRHLNFAAADPRPHKSSATSKLAIAAVQARASSLASISPNWNSKTPADSKANTFTSRLISSHETSRPHFDALPPSKDLTGNHSATLDKHGLSDKPAIDAGAYSMRAHEEGSRRHGRTELGLPGSLRMKKRMRNFPQSIGQQLPTSPPRTLDLSFAGAGEPTPFHIPSEELPVKSISQPTNEDPIFFGRTTRALKRTADGRFKAAGSLPTERLSSTSSREDLSNENDSTDRDLGKWDTGVQPGEGSLSESRSQSLEQLPSSIYGVQYQAISPARVAIDPPPLLAHTAADNQIISTAIKADDNAVSRAWISYTPRGQPFTAEEDALIVHLKEDLKLSWSKIERYFPNRGWAPVQSRYSRKLCKRAQAGLGSSTEISASEVPARRTRGRPSYVPVLPTDEPMDDSKDTSFTDSDAFQYQHAGSKRRGRHPLSSQNISGSARAPEVSGKWAIDPKAVISSEELENRTNVMAATLAGIMDFTSAPPFPSMKLTYLNHEHRELLRKGFRNGSWDRRQTQAWQCKVAHVDFQDEELETMEKKIIDVLKPAKFYTSSSVRRRIQKLLKRLPESKIYEIVWVARKSVPYRNRESIEAFIRDASAGRLNKTSSFEVFGRVAARPSPRQSGLPTASLLRQRETGSYNFGNTRLRPSNQLKNSLYDGIGPAMSFTGTSGDVNSLAWAPDGSKFMAGSACVTDDSSMQYNRPNNLLLGDFDRKLLVELPDHHILRRKAVSGANSSHSMHVSQDPRLFMSISTVASSPDGNYMFSAGYDNYVRIWDVRDGVENVSSLFSLQHKEKIDVLSVSSSGLFATGCRRPGKKSVKVIRFDVDDPKRTISHSFTSRKAAERPDSHTFPSCLRFDPYEGRYLLAGFSSNAKEDGHDTYGEICLWDVETREQMQIVGNSRNVFDCTWNGNRRSAPLFAVGCVAGANVNRGTKSTVRMYDWRDQGKKRYSGMVMELECPAADMNDVLYCPYADSYITVSCTDGKTYVWDLRNPDEILKILVHGKPLTELDESFPRELVDTGVRFCSWGENRHRFYTGSSDGVVKAWDINRSDDDVYVRDIVTLNSGVMSGAFSPDYTRLLLGEVNGSINVLQVGHEDVSLKDMEAFRFIPSKDGLARAEYRTSADADSGIAAAVDLVQSQQISIRPLGGLPIRQAVQGPTYNGPYDAASDAGILRAKAIAFQERLAADSSTEQCNIPLCQSFGALKITSEESGDSGRSKDRIPELLRSARLARSTQKEKVLLGKAKCAKCGLPARLRLPEQEDDHRGKAEVLCERCDFTCFRCGHRAKLSAATDELRCGGCGFRWSADVLGYNLVDQRSKRDTADKEKCLLFGTLETKQETRERLAEEERDGDDGNDLLEYYHGLWMDRPASPV